MADPESVLPGSAIVPHCDRAAPCTERACANYPEQNHCQKCLSRHYGFLKFSFVFYMLFLFIVTYLFICSSMFDTRMTQRVTVVSFTVWTLCRSESSDAWQMSVPSVVTVPCFIITKINQIWSVFLFDLMNTEQLFSENLSWRLKWVFVIEILRCPSSSFLS